MKVIRVPMRPFGKARPRVTRNGTHMPRDYERQRRQLRLLAGNLGNLVPPLAIHVTAVRAMPRSWSGRKRDAMVGEYCQTKPDADNIAGAVMDALLEDDAAVVELSCVKIWGSEDEIRIEIGTAYRDPRP